MKSVAVIGGGISGLSTAYYLQKLHPSLYIYFVISIQITGGSIGGWIQTLHKDKYTFELGPRSIRFASRSMPILDMAIDLGIFDKIKLSQTPNLDLSMYADGKLFGLLPEGYFRKTRFFLKSTNRPILYGFLNRKKKIPQTSDDESINDFARKFFDKASEEEKDYIVNTYINAWMNGIYNGDLNKLSARWTLPWCFLYSYKYGLPLNDIPLHEFIHPESKILARKGKIKKTNAFSFEGGLTLLTDRLYEYIRALPRVEIIDGKATKIEASKNGGRVHIDNGSTIEPNSVISTIASYDLAPLIPDYSRIADIAMSIPHNSLFTASVGFEDRLTMKGPGYLIPDREKQRISGILYDSISFPERPPTMSIMAKCSKSESETIMPTLLEEMQKHTGYKGKVAEIASSYCDKALPQYEVGHHKKVEEIEKLRPKWLHIAGQSFYNSGIGNNVTNSLILAQNFGKEVIE